MLPLKSRGAPSAGSASESVGSRGLGPPDGAKVCGAHNEHLTILRTLSSHDAESALCVLHLLVAECELRPCIAVEGIEVGGAVAEVIKHKGKRVRFQLVSPFGVTSDGSFHFDAWCTRLITSKSTHATLATPPCFSAIFFIGPNRGSGPSWFSRRMSWKPRPISLRSGVKPLTSRFWTNRFMGPGCSPAFSAHERQDANSPPVVSHPPTSRVQHSSSQADNASSASR